MKALKEQLIPVTKGVLGHALASSYKSASSPSHEQAVRREHIAITVRNNTLEQQLKGMLPAETHQHTALPHQPHLLVKEYIGIQCSRV